jgi:hypothetical protein
MANKDLGVKLPEDHRGLMKRMMSFMKNEASFEDTQRALQAKLDALDSPTSFHYLRKVYDDSFIYEVGPGPESSGTPHRKLYRRGYSMAENGVELSDDTAEVREETNYIAIQNETRKEEVKTMSDCKTKVNELIANGGFEEKDREWLESLECSHVTRLGERVQALSAKKPEEKKPEEKKPEEKKPVDNEKKPLTVEDLPEEMRTLLANAKRTEDRRRSELVSKIMRFKGNKFTEDGLKGKAVDDLENIHDLVSANAVPEGDYSFAGGFQTHEGGEEEALETPVMNFDKK